MERDTYIREIEQTRLAMHEQMVHEVAKVQFDLDALHVTHSEAQVKLQAVQDERENLEEAYTLARGKLAGMEQYI